MFKSSWVYFLILSLVLLSGLYLQYRLKFPLITYQDLIKLTPTIQFIQPNPCVFNINGGIPNSPPPDGNIQLNFNCLNGHVSRNYLRFGAIHPPTLKNALTVLSNVNNFVLPQNLKYVISGSPVDEPETNLKVDDVIEIYYE